MAENHHLKGLKLVITGDLESHERDDAVRRLEGLGADVTGSVSGKTRAVIVGKDAGKTKLKAAKERGLPLLDEEQMLALIAGKTLEQVLSDVPASVPEEKKPALPMPFVDAPPRDGLYVEHFPSSEQVRVSGAYQDGLRSGSWKQYFASGQLQQDYEWQRGMKHGHELDWAENGTQTCSGQNRDGKRAGRWVWRYEDGAPSYEYTYDDNGKKSGPHVWDLQDGTTRARGEFVDDKFHGKWVWLQEQRWERLERGYHHGLQHGQDIAWFPGGVLAFKRHFELGYKHGEEEVYEEAGRPTFKGQWLHGFPVGEHLAWDADGNETRTRFREGLPETLIDDEKRRAKVLKKLKKAKDSYAKTDALEDQVEYSQRAPYLLHLWRGGHVDVAKDPELWELLAQAAPLMSGDDVVSFLAQARTKDGYASFLPYWPNALDDIVMRVYARDPAPLDAASDELPGPMQKGLAFVRARFGEDVGAALHDELPLLVKKHVEDYGLGSEVLWPDEHGRVVSQKLFTDYEGTKTPLFDRLLALFGTQERWVALLKEAALAEAKETCARVSFKTFRDVVELASWEEVAQLISGISLDGNTQDLIERALTSWRNDDGETLQRIALAVSDDGLRKWPTVCVAIKKLTAEGKAPSEELLRALPFDSESPGYSSEWYTAPLRDLGDGERSAPAVIAARLPIRRGSAVPRTRLIHEALRALPKESVRAVLERQLETPYRKLAAAQFLYLVDDEDLWRRFVELAEADSYGHMDAVMYGLGDLGLRAVPLLEAAQARAKTKDWQSAWPKAILVALCRAIVDDGDFPAALDRHVRVGALGEDSSAQHYFPFLQRLVHLLPEERAVPILVEGLRSACFSRAFRMIGSHPTREVLEVAFRELLQGEATLKHDALQDVAAGLSSLPNARAWVRWALLSGGGGGAGDAFRTALGGNAYEELQKELAGEGNEAAAPLDDIEKLRRRLDAAGGKGERLYLLRRIDEAPTGGDYNVIGGAAPGVDVSRWPSYDDEPMHHLFTLDIGTMPELGARAGDGVRAISVFCSSPDDNEAYEPGNAQTSVVLSTNAQLQAQCSAPEDLDLRRATRFEVIGVDVDPSVWAEDSELRREIYGASARVLGEPLWLQSDEHYGTFFLQFDEGFVSMNLGDAGVMYVFDDTAFWQCH